MTDKEGSKEFSMLKEAMEYMKNIFAEYPNLGKGLDINISVFTDKGKGRYIVDWKIKHIYKGVK